MLERYRTHGFAYADSPSMTDSRVSLSSPSNVVGQLEQIGDLKLVLAAEMAWDNHQDVSVCARATAPLPARGAPV
jgi:hypothetical protein